jgi:hypothetical protein
LFFEKLLSFLVFGLDRSSFEIGFAIGKMLLSFFFIHLWERARKKREKENRRSSQVE